jgi:hypothetical protein
MSRRHGSLPFAKGKSFDFGVFSNQQEALEAAGLRE